MLRVLVVEDMASIRMMLRHQLIGIGLTDIAMAADGTEALRILDRDPEFDVILSDWHMEPMDGLAFCAAVQKAPKLRRSLTPVVFISADANLQDADKRLRVLARSKNLGIVDILPKPVTTDGLRRSLSRSVGFQI